MYTASVDRRNPARLRNVETSANKVDTDFTKQENMFNIFFYKQHIKIKIIKNYNYY